jgi:hypothetical protein
MNEQRLMIVTYGMTKALNYDSIYKRTVASDVVAELWMLPLERFSIVSYKLFYQVEEYVRYAYGVADLPDWYQEGDIPEEW